MVKRDKRGRVVQRVDGQYSDRVFAMRLTSDEYRFVEIARQKGVDVRDLFVNSLKNKVRSTKHET